jgi:hypothetical protein
MLVPAMRIVPRGVWLTASFLLLSASSFVVYRQLRLNPDQLWSPPLFLKSEAWWKTPLVFGRARELEDFKSQN